VVHNCGDHPQGIQEGDRMNRINRTHRNAIINYLRCKEIHLNSRNAVSEHMYQLSIKEACHWCAIRETIRKGYKRVKQ
jgi:hypothetical protein